MLYTGLGLFIWLSVKHTSYLPAVGGVAETCAKRRSLLRPPSPIPHHPREARVWGMGLAETRAKRGFSASHYNNNIFLGEGGICK